MRWFAGDATGFDRPHDGGRETCGKDRPARGRPPVSRVGISGGPPSGAPAGAGGRAVRAGATGLRRSRAALGMGRAGLPEPGEPAPAGRPLHRSARPRDHVAGSPGGARVRLAAGRAGLDDAAVQRRALPGLPAMAARAGPPRPLGDRRPGRAAVLRAVGRAVLRRRRHAEPLRRLRLGGGDRPLPARHPR